MQIHCQKFCQRISSFIFHHMYPCGKMDHHINAFQCSDPICTFAESTYADIFHTVAHRAGRSSRSPHPESLCYSLTAQCMANKTIGTGN